MAEWFDRFCSGLYTRVLPKTFDEKQTQRQAVVVKRLLKVRKGQSVLDIPCGTGRLTFALARMGLAMTGVDLIDSYIRRGRRQARGEGLAIRFLQGDMRRITFENEFHAAFNWFTSFGYFSDKKNLEFAGSVLRSLRPGGRFLVETVNKSWLLANLPRRMEQVIGGVSMTIVTRWDARRERTISRWTLRRGRVTEQRIVSVRLYDGAALRSLLRAAGFRDVTLYGCAPIGRLTRHSHRLIAVGRKPR